ncbi:MAG TPA: hypothetical protein VH643_16600 [Gemmataceae bacterium]
MGNFWDQFVFRVCVGLGEEHFPEGFASAASLIGQAHRLGRLPMDRLNDLSLLLIVLVCPDAAAAHQQAFAEADRRGLLKSRQTWAVLREALPPRLTDLLLIGHADEGGRRKGLVSGVIHVLYLPALVRFGARLALCSTEDAEKWMIPFVHRALRSLDRRQINHDEFLCHLYHQVLIHRCPIADGWPAEPLPWRSNLDPVEEMFLNRCLQLDAESRCTLYLSFYARLNAEQIRCIFRDTSNLRTQDVVDLLRDIWEDLLPDLA